MNRIPDELFVVLWNAAASLGAAVERVCELAGGRVPRWAVVARAVALRAAGVRLQPLADETHAEAGVLTLPRARELAVGLMAKHGLSGWAFRFNGNVRRAGVCWYPTRARPGRIELSRHFVSRNPEAEVLDTILHEIAHALVGPTHGHDAVWRAKCVELGARPERCYGSQVRMPQGKWRATCPACRAEYDRHRRPARLSGWYCRPCGQKHGPLRWQQAG